MTRIGKISTLIAAAVTAVALAGSPASATAITGEIHFTGNWNPLPDGLLGSATAIDFLPGILVSSPSTGIYESIPGSTPATFQDFVFAPLSGTIDPLWLVVDGANTYSFALATINTTYQSDLSLILFGTGTLSATGYEDTPGTWQFTGQGVDNFSFSANSNANPIPEPATMILLGSGLLGVAGLSRRRKT
jgi:hypothetical protein